MRKPASLLLSLVVLVTMAFSAGLTSAAPSPTPRTATPSTQEVGDPVVVTDIDGNEIGSATIDDIVDPFEDMDRLKGYPAALAKLMRAATAKEWKDRPTPIEFGREFASSL